MATENQKEVPENLRKQLALAVRSIEWSYAIFWSISATKPGILEWVEGYYNGDIKTRKTVQSVEVNADHLGLQRSDQLKELYESLSLGETIPQAKRPTAALSPEDLTDAEWYFLVCMSFVFDIGQGLPGRTFAKNEMIWLCNAHRADTKVFSRSILAKSASIQTIVCFPYLGGVVELGATELVQEDPNLIHHIRTSFLESPSNVPKILNRVSNNITNNNGLICEVLDHANMPGNDLDHILDGPDFDICSPTDISADFADNLLREEPDLVEAVDGEVTQIQNFPFMEDSVSNCLNNSTNSSDCISSKETDNRMNGTQDQGDETHYQSVLSSLLKGSHQLILGPYLKNGNKESSFVSWKNDRFSGARVAQNGTPQRLLKKVLFEVAKMHENCRVQSDKQNAEKDIRRGSGQAFDEIEKNHVLSERKRREKINERFLILGSLVPSGGKVDKVSVLDHTIEYLRGLERKVKELQSYKDIMERESTTQTKPHDALERTSDNYGPKAISNVKKPLTNKRKACETDKNGAETSKLRLRGSLKENIIVNITNKDVLIEIICSWRECVLLEVMEEISKLHLDSESVQSSNVDGMLSMTVKAKCKGVKAASESVIKQALQKVVRKS